MPIRGERQQQAAEPAAAIEYAPSMLQQRQPVHWHRPGVTAAALAKALRQRDPRENIVGFVTIYQLTAASWSQSLDRCQSLALALFQGDHRSAICRPVPAAVNSLFPVFDNRIN